MAQPELGKKAPAAASTPADRALNPDSKAAALFFWLFALMMVGGSIFVITIVMGDFVTVNVLGGGKVASIGKAIATELSYLQFPPAAANAMVLLAIVIMMIVALTRIVDIRKEL